MSDFPFMFRRRTCEVKNCDALGFVTFKIKVEDDTEIRFFISATTVLVDWGDGLSTYETSHRYAQGGIYDVRVMGAEINMLDISRCYVLQLELAYCPWLEHLICSGNKLTFLDISACEWLVGLECAMNELTELNIGKNMRLQFLDCNLNQLRRLNLSACEKLVYLFCCTNEISELDLSKCLNIRCVDIGNNCFAAEELDVFFKTLPELQKNREARIMCDLNSGYTNECNLSLLSAKGWVLV